MLATETHKGFSCLAFKTAASFRQWLSKNHGQTQGIWLIIYHKNSGVASINYPDAVDQAICYGWIDSKINQRDENSFFQFFSPRNPKSNWSRVNKEKVERLLAAKKMAEPGLAMVALAQKTGTWTALDQVEQGIIPPDLDKALSLYSNARSFFTAFPPSVKRGILEWINNAKQDSTRQKRIDATAAMAANNERANQYIKK
ncbi:MAG: hypothetical protein EAZ62_03830 [Sphingobacteriia bacterium]|nr:MAG: hypothetical protein EAZ62_03830 [Sphingobacteriia bacterium]